MSNTNKSLYYRAVKAVIKSACNFRNSAIMKKIHKINLAIDSKTPNGVKKIFKKINDNRIDYDCHSLICHSNTKK